MRVPESPPNFMYPDWWAGDDPKAGTDDLPEGQSGGSYSYQNNKSPEFKIIIFSFTIHFVEP